MQLVTVFLIRSIRLICYSLLTEIGTRDIRVYRRHKFVCTLRINSGPREYSGIYGRSVSNRGQ
jgi:hypothetical protein